MMKPGKSVDAIEEIAEVHTTARSPSPKHKNSRNKSRSRSRSGSRKLSNGHTADKEITEVAPKNEDQASDKSKIRDNWINSEHESLDTELPIHEQIKQGIIGFVEKEIKKSDKNPSFVFYSHDPNHLDEKLMKTLSRPSSGHKEKRSPSYRKKKRHSSRHRDRDLHDFEIPGSSLSALEKVDDYLKEYNKEEVVTLSGELEIEENDLENNNGTAKELRHKPRKTRRRARDERQDSNANGRDVSPKVFKTGTKSKSSTKPARPTDLTAMLETLETSMPYNDQYIDNPFSSPSPLTSPNDERLNPFGTRRTEKIYLQGGGTFRAVSRDRILESQQSRDGDKYLRLGDLTPLDVALTAQKAWRSCAPACHGVLGGLSLMHLLLISYSDSLDAGHLSFHAVVTMPYVASYYFFCVLCLLSVLDR
ncbi:serine/arginine-rich splicing factor 4-like [Hyposmocoma kahamanoa]|uniref:serine/arginine-rich splicing factor 4-like n=1 Tax=Hyposmocoma kahamanoa TaxID=1477025 RepID=UPI000E6D6C27|nr:serine/arginine-rich splicing factor 4-like [Hyposmocoma kahamanoa]